MLKMKNLTITSNTIRHKYGGKYPYVQLHHNYGWVLWDFSNIHQRFVPVKELHLPTELDANVLNQILEVLKKWGFSEDGYTPDENDLCYQIEY